MSLLLCEGHMIYHRSMKDGIVKFNESKQKVCQPIQAVL